MSICIWLALSAALHIAPGHPRVLLGGDRLVALKASMERREPAATRFRDMVDSQLKSGRVYSFQGHFAALLYQVTQDRRYADYAVSFVDAKVADDEGKIAEAQLPSVARDSYLYVGATIGDVALTYDWCFDRLTLEQRRRWVAYGNQAVSNVWNPRGASWGGRPQPWSGWSVTTPATTTTTRSWKPRCFWASPRVARMSWPIAGSAPSAKTSAGPARSEVRPRPRRRGLTRGNWLRHGHGSPLPALRRLGGIDRRTDRRADAPRQELSPVHDARHATHPGPFRADRGPVLESPPPPCSTTNGVTSRPWPGCFRATLSRL